MTSSRWLAAFGVAVLVLHHLGSIAGPSGGFGAAGSGTQWVDWLDLLTPYLVVGPALLALAASAADRTSWLVAALGALAYASGHGIHLAANSISNAQGDAAPTHLWDELVGHAVWYAGLALIVIALARSVEPKPTVTGWVLAVGVGLTWATNGLGADGLVVPMLIAALALAVWGWTRRGRSAGRLLLVAYGVASPVLLVGAVLG